MASYKYPAAGGSSPYWGDPVASAASLPGSGAIGEVRLVRDTDDLYEWNGAAWEKITENLADVQGPASATDDGIARFDGTTGKLIQDSSASIDDQGVITATGFSGDLTGNVTGDVTGNVTGDLTGNVTGDVTGNLTGDVTGNVTGDVTGNVTGDLTGNVTGDVTGNLTGDVTGNVTGDLTGDVTGNVTGDVTGDLTGDVTGDVLGDVTGNLTGNVTGNVTGDIDSVATGGVDTLNIGTTNADVVNIGRSGSLINLQGTTAYQNVTNFEVSDKNITVNKGGTLASGTSAGIEVEEDSVVTGYCRTSGDRNSWVIKAPNAAGDATITPGSGGITLNQSSHDPVTIGTGNGLSLSTQALSLAAASASQTGALTSTDWSTFNGKQAAITGGASTILSSDLTASRALVSDTNGKVAAATTTSTEIGYVNGVTSAIQTQLNEVRAGKSVVSVTGNVTLTDQAIHLVSTASARSLTLPTPSASSFIVIKDSTGSCATNNITVVRAGSEKIETVAASFTLDTDLGAWTFVSNGTDWFVI